MPTRLPESFRPLLWSYDFDRLNPQKNRKTIILQAINYGTLTHWLWLNRVYGFDSVRKVLTTVPATENKPRTRQLAALVFGIDQFNYAPRGTH